MARTNLQRAGLGAVKVLHRDGAADLSDLGPFDAILLSGSVAQVPDRLLTRLKPGGRLMAIVGDLPIMRARLWRYDDQGRCAHVDVFDTAAPRLLNFDEPSRFRF